MPNIVKKQNRNGENEVKVQNMEFVGLPQQGNTMGNYLIKRSKESTFVPVDQRNIVGNSVQEKYSNRFGVQQPPTSHRLGTNGNGYGPKSSAADLVKSVLPKTVLQNTTAQMGVVAAMLPPFAEYRCISTESDDNGKARKHLNPSSESSSDGGTTKPDIISYYRAQGLDYFEERKKCRQYVHLKGVYWDDYDPPPGYTWKDLEGIPLPVEPVPESPNGFQISPCVSMTRMLKLKTKTPESPQIPTSQQFREIDDQLLAIGADREKHKEERRKRKEERRKKKEANLQKLKFDKSVSEVECVEQSLRQNNHLPEHETSDCAFPNDEDSFVQRATQLEECVIVTNKQSAKSCEIVDEKKNLAVLSPRNRKNMGGHTPLNRGNRLTRRSKSLLDLDCKVTTVNRLKRPPTGRLDFSNEVVQNPAKKSPQTPSPDVSSILFEESKVENVSNGKIDKGKDCSKMVVGDFVDDDDDDVFSQMPMPVLPEQQCGKTIPINEKSTVVVSGDTSANSSAFDEGSFLTADVLTAMDQWEAKATGQPSVYTSTPMQNSNRVVGSPELGSGIRKSSRLKNNNLSAIRAISNPRLLNESGTPKSGARLSRSFARSRK